MFCLPNYSSECTGIYQALLARFLWSQTVLVVSAFTIPRYSTTSRLFDICGLMAWNLLVNYLTGKLPKDSPIGNREAWFQGHFSRQLERCCFLRLGGKLHQYIIYSWARSLLSNVPRIMSRIFCLFCFVATTRSKGQRSLCPNF